MAGLAWCACSSTGTAAGSDANAAAASFDATTVAGPDALAADDDANVQTLDLPRRSDTIALATGLWTGGPPVAATAWLDLGSHPFDAAGRTALITATVPAGVRFVALRTRADKTGPAEPACMRLADVTTAAGAVWVGPPEPGPDSGACANCVQSVHSGRGYVMAVFPNDGKPLGSIGSLTFRVTLRHCETSIELGKGMLGSQITAVAVDVASEPAVSAASVGTLDVVVAAAPGAWPKFGGAGTGQGEATVLELASSPLASAIVARLTSAFEGAGVTVRVRGWLALPPGAAKVNPLIVTEAQSDATDALQATFDAALANVWQQRGITQPAAAPRIVPIVFVPCLEAADPVAGNQSVAGMSLRIPGGGRIGPYASMVLLSTDRCGARTDGPDAKHIPTIVAHELGHYLGLYHTDAAQGLARAETATDLMHSKIAMTGPWDAAFTAKQATVLRGHPDIVFGGTTP
ncbi:MAG: hypothetical protein EXR79_17035 [Myxococcales bacterium]|nr:hypothetical protein [Myxococcales bacterium]